MSSTILVWFLVTVGGYNSNTVTYSPPLATETSCEHLRKSMPSTYGHVSGRCIQLDVPVMSLPAVATAPKPKASK